MARQIVVLGDSHTDAIKNALKSFELPAELSIRAFRYSRLKDGKQIGDLDVAQVTELISKVNSEDLIASTIGGNQHQVVSLMQHPQPYDFYSKDYVPSVTEVSDNNSIIPYNVFFDYFWKGITGGNDGRRLLALKSSSCCPVVHIAPPPPKKDVDHILRFHETHFSKAGLVEYGVSPAQLRLKVWKLQLHVLKQFCLKNDINLLLPPSEAIDSEGFLSRDCYAKDATHGNQMYGNLVVNQLIDCLGQNHCR